MIKKPNQHRQITKTEGELFASKISSILKLYREKNNISKDYVNNRFKILKSDHNSDRLEDESNTQFYNLWKISLLDEYYSENILEIFSAYEINLSHYFYDYNLGQGTPGNRFINNSNGQIQLIDKINIALNTYSSNILSIKYSEVQNKLNTCSIYQIFNIFDYRNQSFGYIIYDAKKNCNLTFTFNKFIITAQCETPYGIYKSNEDLKVSQEIEFLSKFLKEINEFSNHLEKIVRTDYLLYNSN